MERTSRMWFLRTKDGIIKQANSRREKRREIVHKTQVHPNMQNDTNEKQ